MVSKSSIIGSVKISNFDINEIEKISFFYLNKSVELFEDKSILTNTNEGKWKEFIYCILAGTQFPVTKLKTIFPLLFSKYENLFNIKSFKTKNESKRNDVAVVLKSLGYRYHTQKANTIVNSGTFFNEKFNGNIEAFLNTHSDVDLIRKKLVNEIKGVGIKIASHWLRNIGMPVCTVDVHLRRLLYNLRLSEENPEGPLKDSDFLILENIFREWSVILNVNLGILQFSIWEYTREFCAHFNCTQCSLVNKCKRGEKSKEKNKGGRLF